VKKLVLATIEEGTIQCNPQDLEVYENGAKVAIIPKEHLKIMIERLTSIQEELSKIKIEFDDTIEKTEKLSLEIERALLALSHTKHMERE
jgi:hypothetical protein